MEERLFICIDGENLCIKFGESIYQALEKLNLDRNSISTIPLAALIDGKMFDLHYAPVTECDIKLVRFDSEAGRRVYERSLKYIVLYVMKQLYEDVELIEQHSWGTESI